MSKPDQQTPESTQTFATRAENEQESQLTPKPKRELEGEEKDNRSFHYFRA